jgi:MFS family permease
MAYVLGSVACAAAPNGTAFTVAVAIYEFSKGYPPAIASVIASVAEKAGIVQHSAVYATVATAEGIGAIISGPVIAGAFNVGLQWGGAWYGLPFWICSLLYLVAAVIIFNVRATKVE